MPPADLPETTPVSVVHEAQPQQPQPKRSRKKWPLIVVGILILLLGVFFVLTHNGATNTANTANTAQQQPLQMATSTVVISDKSQYLIFNIGVLGTYPQLPIQSTQIYDSIHKKVSDTIAPLGSMTGDSTHRLGFMVILPVWVWNSGLGNDHREADIIIEQAFKVAKDYNLAVYFALDTNYGETPNIWNWFDPSQDGYNPANKKNVEWTDWDGTPTKARYNLQGSGAKLPPVMCYNSPEVLSQSAYLATTVIAPPILKGIADLTSVGKENLFAGITVGMEPSLDNYSVIDQLDPAIARHMDQDGAAKVRLGYCALTNLGYSASNPPASYPDALAAINNDYTTYWAKELVTAGIPKDKLYTHVPADADALQVQYTNAPIGIAFNEYSRPGFTTYAAGPIADNFDSLYQTLAEHGSPHWGATETSPTSVTGKPLNPENFLAWHYNHGADLMVINTADTSAGGQVVGKDIWSSASVAAYKKFLSGDTLQE